MAAHLLPITRWTAQRGSPAPEIHPAASARPRGVANEHLWPLITMSLPSLRIDVWMFVASDEAMPFSVMANEERILPSSSGCSHFFFCASLP